MIISARKNRSPLPNHFIILILLFSVWLASGCATTHRWGHLPESPGDETTVYVVSHGWHTGIVISKENLDKELSFLSSYLGESPYYEIGWGDKGFYQAEAITIGVTMRALTGLSDGSVLHVVALPEEPKRYFAGSQTIEVRISKVGNANLNNAISQSFKKGSDGRVISTKNGIYGHSMFFEGKGKYYVINTCNTWTAKVLNQAGVPIRTFLTLTASSVMEQTKSAMNGYSCCPMSSK